MTSETPVETWPDLLTDLVAGAELTPARVAWAMGEIFDARASTEQIAALAVGLRAKGETASELAAMVEALLARARAVSAAHPRGTVDVVGTGGDRHNTVNISTMAAIVAAAAGAAVVKHGNRASSSACGTADVLEEIGVVLDVEAEAQQQILDEVGIAFLFAPVYHPAMAQVGSTRKALRIATAFNLIGPLANPARPDAQALGVADPAMTALLARVVATQGRRGLVFSGGDGLDELTTTTTSDVWSIPDGVGPEAIEHSTLDPRDLGLAPARIDDLVGGDAAHNAEVLRRVLGGEPGPVADIVALNAAAALLAVAGPRPGVGVTEQLVEPLARSRAVLADGSGLTLVERWAAVTRRLADWTWGEPAAVD